MTGPVGRVDPPAPRPCESCPYRLDVPAGVWAPEEYARLFYYDRPTAGQPTGVFCCHHHPGRVCAGWANTHADRHNLALRLTVGRTMTVQAVEDTLAYRSPVPCFPTGADAAMHGLSGVADPSPEAETVMSKLEQRPGGFTCPVCGATSWNPNDIREGYCGQCHAWTSELQEEHT